MKNLLFAFGIMCFLLFTSGSTSGQITINGVLQDSVEFSPLSFANIALIKQIDSAFITGTTTDDKGLFKLNLSDTGKYFLRISYLGYGTQFKQFSIGNNEIWVDLGTVFVSKSAQNLEEVVISIKTHVCLFR